MGARSGRSTSRGSGRKRTSRRESVGASLSESEGIGPALTACDWSVGQGERALSVQIQSEAVQDIEPGHHVELNITLVNRGRRVEAGLARAARFTWDACARGHDAVYRELVTPVRSRQT